MFFLFFNQSFTFHLRTDSEHLKIFNKKIGYKSQFSRIEIRFQTNKKGGYWELGNTVCLCKSRDFYVPATNKYLTIGDNFIYTLL